MGSRPGSLRFASDSLISATGGNGANGSVGGTPGLGGSFAFADPRTVTPAQPL